MYDLKGGKIPHTYLISVLLEEGMIMAFSSIFYFSKLFFFLSCLYTAFLVQGWNIDLDQAQN